LGNSDRVVDAARRGFGAAGGTWSPRSALFHQVGACVRTVTSGRSMRNGEEGDATVQPQSVNTSCSFFRLGTSLFVSTTAEPTNVFPEAVVQSARRWEMHFMPTVGGQAM